MTTIPELTGRQTAVLICVLFTALTLISSVIGLLQGETTDTHLHLLTRLVYTAVGVGAVHLFGVLRRRVPARPVVVASALTYVVVMAVVLLLTWVLGTRTPLHPDAYRDIAVNFTVVYVAVASSFGAYGRWRRPASD